MTKKNLFFFSLFISRLNELSPHFALLASDGLWDTHSNDAAAAFVKKVLKKSATETTAASAGEFLEAAKSLVIDAYRKESLDNITVLILNLKEFNSGVR